MPPTIRENSTTDEGKRKAASERAAILTPIAKAYATDIGIDVASTGVQVHGGMGFVEETGAAQLMRDARILGIYEGTNGIQAIDLTARKLPLNGGATARSRHQLAALSSNRPETALAGATPYLRLFGLVLGGACLARSALAASAALKAGETDPAHAGRIALARFYAENLMTAAEGLEQSVVAGGAFTDDAALALAV